MQKAFNFHQNIRNITSKNKDFFDDFIHGLKLKSYNFKKYKTKKEKKYLKINIFKKNY